MSPFAKARCCWGNQFAAARALAGWSGVVSNPISERTINKDSQTWLAAMNPQPTMPVNAQNKAVPIPIAASATRGPKRSMNKPPGIIKTV